MRKSNQWTGVQSESAMDWRLGVSLAVEGVGEESELASESKTMYFFSRRGKGFEGHPFAGQGFDGQRRGGQRDLGYQRVVSYTY